MRNLLTGTRFMALWIAGSIIVVMVMAIVSVLLLLLFSAIATAIWANQQRAPGLVDGLVFTLVLCSLIGGWFGVSAGNLQKFLLRQKSGESFHGWVWASIAGAVLGINAMVFIVGAQLLPEIGSSMTIRNAKLIFLMMQVAIIPLAIMSIAQLPILWRYVRGAWTWVLANVVAGIVLISLLLAGSSSITSGWGTPAGVFLLLAMIASPGIVTGFAAVWLLVNNSRYR